MADLIPMMIILILMMLMTLEKFDWNILPISLTFSNSECWIRYLDEHDNHHCNDDSNVDDDYLLLLLMTMTKMTMTKMTMTMMMMTTCQAR